MRCSPYQLLKINYTKKALVNAQPCRNHRKNGISQEFHVILMEVKNLLFNSISSPHYS